MTTIILSGVIFIIIVIGVSEFVLWLTLGDISRSLRIIEYELKDIRQWGYDVEDVLDDHQTAIKDNIRRLNEIRPSFTINKDPQQ